MTTKQLHQKIHHHFNNGQLSFSKISLTLIEKLQQALQPFKKEAPKNPHLQAYYDAHGCKISIYKTRSVVFNAKNPAVLGDFITQLKELETILITLFTSQPKQSQTNYNPKKPLETDFYQFGIGGDESGKGDFFGGIVICVCHLDEEVLTKIKQKKLLSQIKDSKLIKNHAVLTELAIELITILTPQNFEVCALDPNQYNLLHNSFANSLISLTYLYKKALTALQQKLTHWPQFIIIDQYVNHVKFQDYNQSINYIQSENNKPIFSDYQIQLLPKAENHYLSVAIASIIARYYFLIQIKNLSEKYHYQLPLGCSYIGANSVLRAYYNLKNQANLPAELIQQKLAKKDFQKTWKKIFSLV